MDQKIIQNIKKGLLSEKKRLEEELGKVAKKKGKKFTPTYPEYGSKEEENAAEMTEYALHFALDKNLEKLLSEVVLSLAKIDLGTYGKCSNCSKEINPDRLQAFPAATLCIECQAKKEKNPFKKLLAKIKERKEEKVNHKNKKSNKK